MSLSPPTSFMEFIKQQPIKGNSMPQASTPEGQGALQAYQDAIGGKSTGTPYTVAAANSWRAGMDAAAAAAAEAQAARTTQV